MTDIVKRLRQATKPRWKMTGQANVDAGAVEFVADPLAQEAAAEIKRLRAVLRAIAAMKADDDGYHAVSIAREALGDN